MKVRIKVRPTGYISLAGQPLTAWPPAGSVVDLPEAVARDQIAAGRAEKVPGWSGREWQWPWHRPQTKPSGSGPTEMTVRITARPTGCVSLHGGPLSAWPKVGTVVDLPYAVAEGLIAGGFAETPEASEPKTVRLRVTRAWPKVGTEIDLPEDIARGLVAGGMADEVTHPCP